MACNLQQDQWDTAASAFESRSVSSVRLWRAAATSGKHSPAAAQGGGSSRKQVRLDERRVGKEFVISIYEISDACIIIFDEFIADGFSQ